MKQISARLDSIWYWEVNYKRPRNKENGNWARLWTCCFLQMIQMIHKWSTNDPNIPIISCSPWRIFLIAPVQSTFYEENEIRQGMWKVNWAVRLSTHILTDRLGKQQKENVNALFWSPCWGWHRQVLKYSVQNISKVLTKTTAWLLVTYNELRGWRGDSGAKSICCACRGPRFSHYPCSSSLPSLTAIPWDPMTSSDINRYCIYVVKYIQAYKAPIHIKENKQICFLKKMNWDKSLIIPLFLTFLLLPLYFIRIYFCTKIQGICVC